MDLEKGRDASTSGPTGPFDDETMNTKSNHPTHLRDEQNKAEINERIDVEKADSPSSSNASTEGLPNLAPTNSSVRNIISFEPNDPTHPHNFNKWKKLFILSVSIITVLNSTLNSSLSSNSAEPIGQYFGITNGEQLILPTSIYLLGYVVGPLVWGPLSEQYGRKYIMQIAFAFFTTFTMAVALAPNFPALVIFRLFTGMAAACPIAVVGGTCADIYSTPEARGRAMAFFMASTTLGPCAGPLLSGFIAPSIGWRWTFWVGLIFAGIAWLPLLLVPETFAPVILKRRAKKMRKELRAKENTASLTAEEMPYAAIELESQEMSHIITVVLMRPVRMFLTEALVLFSCLYMAFAYGIFYLFLVAYPIIYEGVYGFNPGEEGLAFLGIALGAVIACGIYVVYDGVLRRAKAKNAAWAQSEEFRRLPLACAAGPFFVISCFWVGWSARPDVHWIVPILSGIPFGIGYLLLFMALLNYLVDAYKIFAASAMAASSATRSLFGATLPFATTPMYNTLGIAWACSLLGFLSLLMSIIPFIFIWKGDRIRARSKFCQYLAEREREEEAKAQRREARALAKAAAATETGKDAT